MATEYNMEVGSFLRFSVESAKKHWLKFLGLEIASLAVIALIAAIGFKIHPLAGSLLASLIGLLAFLGILRASLDLAVGKPFDVRAFVPEPAATIRFAAATILYLLMTCLGCVFLLVPGIILGLIFSQAPLLALEGRGVIESFGESARMTKGHKMDIFLGLLVVGIIASILNMLVLPMLFTIPMQAFAQVYTYVLLTGKLSPR